jgi:hypothetical protein
MRSVFAYSEKAAQLSIDLMFQTGKIENEEAYNR